MDQEADRRRDPHLRVDRVQHRPHPLAGIGVLDRGAGEELDRADVGVGIDDPPRKLASRLGLKVGDPLQAGQEDGHDRAVEGEVDEERYDEAKVGLREEEQGRGDVDGHVDHQVRQLHHRLAHAERGLHQLGREAAREVVREEGARLAQEGAVRAPPDRHRHVGHDALEEDKLVEKREERPDERDQAEDQEELAAMRVKEPLAPRLAHPADDLAHEVEGQDLDEGDRDGEEDRRGEQPAERPHVVPDERDQPRGRGLGRPGGQGVRQALEEAEHARPLPERGGARQGRGSRGESAATEGCRRDLPCAEGPCRPCHCHVFLRWGRILTR